MVANLPLRSMSKTPPAILLVPEIKSGKRLGSKSFELRMTSRNLSGRHEPSSW